MMNDPIADMLTRIRNALIVGHASVHVPRSRMKEGIAKVLAGEGYIEGYELVERQGKPSILIQLKYMGARKPVIEGIERVSRPGRRVYAGNQDLPRVREGLGMAVLTTSKGIMSDAQARDSSMGGEVLLRVW
jgi:small subunit ribosomal protein S8